MPSTILNQLKELQEQSDKRLSIAIINAIQNQDMPRALVVREFVSNAIWATKPRNGVKSLFHVKNTQSLRKAKTLTPGHEGNVTFALNTALLGGRSYPILTAALSTAIGLAGFVSGLLFTAGTTVLSLSKTSHRILARSGDEIWHVEEIGKVQHGGSYKAVYVSSFFIVDPFRGQSYNGQSNARGWLIHEEREELTLSD